jgi:hypothetical protein
MDAEAEHDHLEGISLLSASLAPGVENVAAIVQVPQVGLGGAHRPDINFSQNMLRSSPQTVSILSPSLSPHA